MHPSLISEQRVTAVYAFVDPAGRTSKQPAKAAVPTGLTPAAGAVGAGGVRALWRLSDMLARPEEFRRVLSREVLSGKQVAMGGVVMLEAPVDATHLQVRAALFLLDSASPIMHV